MENADLPFLLASTFEVHILNTCSIVWGIINDPGTTMNGVDFTGPLYSGPDQVVKKGAGAGGSGAGNWDH